MITNKFSKVLIASLISLLFAILYSFGFWNVGLGIGLLALGNGGKNYSAQAIMVGLPLSLAIVCLFIQFKILNSLLKLEKWKIVMWMVTPFLLIPLFSLIIAQNELDKSHKYVQEWSKKAHAPDEFARTIRPKITVVSYSVSKTYSSLKNANDISQVDVILKITAERPASVNIIGELGKINGNSTSGTNTKTINIDETPVTVELAIKELDPRFANGLQQFDELRIEMTYNGKASDYPPEAQLDYVIVYNLQDSGESKITPLPFGQYDGDHRKLLYSINLQK